MPDPHQASRYDFIKGADAVVGGLIGALISIPSVAFLFSPRMKSDVETDAGIALGSIKNYPIGIPTRFDFTQAKVNGWKRTATNYRLYGELFVQLPPIKREA